MFEEKNQNKSHANYTLIKLFKTPTDYKNAVFLKALLVSHQDSWRQVPYAPCYSAMNLLATFSLEDSFTSAWSLSWKETPGTHKNTKAPDPLLTTRKLNQDSRVGKQICKLRRCLGCDRSTNLTAGVRWGGEHSKINFFTPSNTWSQALSPSHESALHVCKAFLKLLCLQKRGLYSYIYGTFWKIKYFIMFLMTQFKPKKWRESYPLLLS